MTAVVTTGAQVPDMETVDGQIYVESFLDGDLVMEESDLVVCHGGNGTIYQALLHGKPIIGIPTIPDQGFNMRRVQALGIGKSITWKEFNGDPRIFLDTIDTVLADLSFAQRARRMQAMLKNYKGEKIGADLIEGYIAEQIQKG